MPFKNSTCARCAACGNESSPSTLRGIRLLSVSKYLHCHFLRLKTQAIIEFSLVSTYEPPICCPLNEFVLQEVLYAYRQPSKIDTDHVWVDWMFRLRQPNRRHALEFVGEWNGTRIAVAGMTPLMFFTLVGAVWSARSGDI